MIVINLIINFIINFIIMTISFICGKESNSVKGGAIEVMITIIFVVNNH